MSLRITPASNHATSTSNTQTSKLVKSSSNTFDRGAPSAPGLPDTLRASHNTKSSSTTTTTSASGPLTSTHPLESRLANWQSTQAQLHNTLLRRNFGIAVPLRMQMEQQMVRKADGFRPGVLGAPAGVHQDILCGRDAEVAWEDVYAGQDGLRGIVDAGGDGQGVGWTEEMEVKVGMGKL